MYIAVLSGRVSTNFHLMIDSVRETWSYETATARSSVGELFNKIIIINSARMAAIP